MCILREVDGNDWIGVRWFVIGEGGGGWERCGFEPQEMQGVWDFPPSRISLSEVDFRYNFDVYTHAAVTFWVHSAMSIDSTNTQSIQLILQNSWGEGNWTLGWEYSMQEKFNIFHVTLLGLLRSFFDVISYCRSTQLLQQHYIED